MSDLEKQSRIADLAAQLMVARAQGPDSHPVAVKEAEWCFAAAEAFYAETEKRLGVASR